MNAENDNNIVVVSDLVRERPMGDLKDEEEEEGEGGLWLWE